MKRLIFLFTLIIITSIKSYADDIHFVASAPEAVISGEQFRVSYTINTQKVKDFRAPAFDGFDVLMGPSRSQQSSMSSLNGSVTKTSSITFTFILLAKEEGSFSIPEASIVAEGKSIISNSLKIRVLPPDQHAVGGNARNSTLQRSRSSKPSASSGNSRISDQDLFITATLNKTNVYEQEAVLLTYKVYFLVNLRELPLKIPDLKGFHAQEIDLKRDRPTLEHYNGRNYQTIVWSQYVLFPQQSGKLEIPSITFDATVAMQHDIDPFEAFFNGVSNYVEMKKPIVTPKLIVNVEPLPGGKPTSYSSAVGDFSLKSSISTNQLKTNDAVTIKLEIAGTGNMKLINTPEVLFPQDFDEYDPKVENQFVLTKNGLSGKKTFEYLAIPRHAGTFTIPAIEFSYFDVKTKSYRTLKTESYELNVEKGASSATEQQITSNFTNKEDVKLIGQDIRYIKTRDIILTPRNVYFFGSYVYIMWYVVPLLFSILLVIIYRRRALENANLVKVRTKNANKVAVKRLKLAAKLLADDKKEDFYDEILKALWGYISDKLNIPVSQLSKDNVAYELKKYGVEQILVDRFVDILNECEFARYAPGSDNQIVMDKFYLDAMDVISEMENTIK